MSKGEGIRIFLRVRPPPTSKHSNFLSSSNGEHATCDYDIENSFQGSDIKFHVSKREVGEFVNNSSEDYKFSFRRVFDQRASQEEVFNVVSKDCVMSVLDGYNSTIFAYGQTGSGKTYSITGGTESYQDRGIIPRALAMVYDEIAKRTDTTWNVNLSYLQIYNDKGQDLLNHGKDAKTLEDLSPVTVHEGEEEVTLKGLEQHRAPALADALNLLFLGDTNRLYCETPMNKTSSRSHCVFTVSLEARSGGSSVIRRSKLNLVDLAGSERVSKTGVNGTLLSEAKYINLSLHYLEHVIIALSEQAKGKRDHVPYRNSFMTMVLRDSLGGNCRTSMLATAHMAKSMLPETISTCQFAQRVALIRQNAHVNEVTDPLLLVKKLKAEVSQLKDRLAFHEGGGAGADRALTDDEKHLCRGLVDTYMENSDPEARIEGFEGDLARIYYCFSLLKDMTKSGKGSSGGGNVQASRDIDNGSFASAATMAELDGKATKYRQQVEELQLSLQQKENEMNVLFDMLQQTQRMKFNVETQTVDVGSSSNSSSGAMDVVQREVVDAHQLIRSLRSGGRRGSMMVLSQTPAIPPTAALSSSVITTQAGAAEAAKAHVTTLATAGKLTEAEATAAQEYFARKEERLAESYNLSALTDAELLNDRTAAFEAFKQSYRNYSKVEATKAELKQKYDDCKSTARSLNACVDSIKQVKTQVQRLRAERAVDGVEEIDPEEATLLQRLGSEKDVYNTLAATLRSQKEGIDGMHAFMKRAQDQLTRDFEDWLATRQKQVARAMSRGAQPGGGGGAHEQVPISSQVAHPPPSVGAAVSGGGGGHTGLTFPSPGIAQSARTASAGKLHSAPTMSSQLASTASATIAPLTSHMNNTAVLSSTAVASTLNNGGSGAAAAAGVMGRHPASAPSAAGYNEMDSAGIATGRQGSLPSPRLGAGGGGLPVASIANQWIAPAGAAVGSPLGPSPPLNRSRLAVNLTSPTDANAGGGGGSSNSLLASTNGVSSTNVVGASGKWMSSPPSNPYHLAPLNTTASGIENSSPQLAVAVSNSSTGDMNARNFLMTTSTTTTTTSATASEVGHQYLPGRNPYAPEHRSTGNTAADEQLAALYRAREELRKQFQ